MPRRRRPADRLFEAGAYRPAGGGFGQLDLGLQSDGLGPPFFDQGRGEQVPDGSIRGHFGMSPSIERDLSGSVAKYEVALMRMLRRRSGLPRPNRRPVSTRTAHETLSNRSTTS